MIVGRDGTSDPRFACAYRAARPDERVVLEDLQRRSSLAIEEDRAALLADPGLIRLPPEHVTPGHAVVAEHGGKAVGFAVVLQRADGDAELDGLFVDPVHWRRGVGRELVIRARCLAVDRGAARLWVVANPAARAFYESCGFRHVGDVETQLRMAHLMNVDLAGVTCASPD